jgi:hypothetical protein
MLQDIYGTWQRRSGQLLVNILFPSFLVDLSPFFNLRLLEQLFIYSSSDLILTIRGKIVTHGSI